MEKHGTLNVTVGEVFSIPTDQFAIMPFEVGEGVSISLYLVKDTQKNGKSSLSVIDPTDWTMVINCIPMMNFVLDTEVIEEDESLSEEESEEEPTEPDVIELQILY